MRKTLRELHFEIEHIMNLSVQELNTSSKKELLEHLKELKWNCKYVEAEKKRHTYSYNIQSNAERRIIDIEKQMEIINEIINQEETVKNKEINSSMTHPFENDKMLELFNYIIRNWDYNKDLKYAYIFNELMPENQPPGKYENYIRKNHKQIGKFNYNNANSKTVIDNLRQIINSQ
ncbi:hypothetical protein [Polaribacter sargassicola]|uniref:hypothetical protein n=1 Tax=Polaribacter sargassicola TaxID=2836891 RepID=UPI001F189E3C|nr:hypothetical protein [Polaribacter sp. DS7-9]MCG1035738.1 hypothetical protein [Polaribacter sp. DS7-9]